MHDILATMPGNLYVKRDPAALGRFSHQSASFTSSPPLAIVEPVDIQSLRELVLWANAKECPLIPVSSSAGARGQGEATASARPAIIVDMSGMRRIVHVNGRDAIAVIEPGVTFPEFDSTLKMACDPSNRFCLDETSQS